MLIASDGSHNMLKTAGYAESPAFGIWRITPRGRDLIALFPTRFEDEMTRRIVRESRTGTGIPGPDDGGEGGTESLPLVSQQTPEERIEAALQEL
jgi:hypothetical protein